MQASVLLSHGSATGAPISETGRSTNKAIPMLLSHDEASTQTSDPYMTAVSAVFGSSGPEGPCSVTRPGHPGTSGLAASAMRARDEAQGSVTAF
jgi:hypothetical protein